MPVDIATIGRAFPSFSFSNVQAVPSFLTIAVMPMTYSVAYGVVAGLVSYIVINGSDWLLDACQTGARRLPALVRRRRQSKSDMADKPEMDQSREMHEMSSFDLDFNPVINGVGGKSNNSSSSDLEAGLRLPRAKSRTGGPLPPAHPLTQNGSRKGSFAGIGTGLVGSGGSLRGGSRGGSPASGTTPASTPGNSQHGPQQGAFAFGSLSHAASSDNSPSTSIKRSNSSLALFGGKGSRSGKQAPARARRVTEGGVPLQRSKPRRVRTQTFDEAWGGEDERRSAQGGSARSFSGNSSFGSNGFCSASALEPSLLDFPGAFGTDTSPTARSTSGSPVGPPARCQSLGQLPEGVAVAAKPVLELPDFSHTPSPLDLKTFADLFGPAQKAACQQPLPSATTAAPPVEVSPSSVTRLANETTNELTMRDMFASGGSSGVDQLRDPSVHQRGKMPTFETLDESSPAASDASPLSTSAAEGAGTSQQPRSLRPEALEAVKAAEQHTAAASKPRLVRSSEIRAFD